MSKRLTLLAFTIFLLPFCLQAQHTVQGRITTQSNDAIQGATVRLVNTRDSTIQLGNISNRLGAFEIKNVPSGQWGMFVSSVGFVKHVGAVTIASADVDLGSIQLSADTVALRSVDVEADVIASELRGDTAQFNAKGFKTNVNATSEELVAKMPGVTIENGTVKAQGEDVKRVLVDGKRFFGDDAKQTLQNVPADMVENVQVYDARSNISMYSGFDDGNTEKTMNLITKKDKRKGAFGNVQGGYGTDNRYNGSTTMSMFNDAQRITLLGLTNNINQQNFSVQDLLGSMGITGGRASMMSGMANRTGGAFMFSRMGGGASNLFVGQANGISTTHAIGSQYSDQWGENTNVSGSYFFNYSDNNNNSTMNREYVQPLGQLYAENNSSNTLSRNHRLNFRMESTIDSMNTILIEPRVSYQNRDAYTGLSGATSFGTDSLSSTNTSTENQPQAFTAGIEVDYSHRFNTEGRTLAVELNSEYRNSSADGMLQSLNTFQTSDSSAFLDQISTQKQNGTTYGGELSWVEPLGSAGMLRLRYEPTVTVNDADKQTHGLDTLTGNHSLLLPQLTNTYSNTYTTQVVGLTHRYQFDNTIITAGVGYQMATLSGDVTYPTTATIRRDFYNVLPELQVRQRFSKQSEATFRYRVNTQPPSISQLQNVIDNSNPLQLSTGNPNLSQSVDHNLMVRFRDVDWMAGKTLFGFVSADFMQNYVSTQTTVTRADTTVNNVHLPPGATITAPVNINGYVGLHSFMTYGLKLDFVKSNLNINGGVNYTRTPSLVNGQTNVSNNNGVRLGFYLSSNISEDLDLSMGYDANYNIIANTLMTNQDANYFNHTATGRLIWNLGMLACSTDVVHTMFRGLGEGYDQTYTVWNAGIGLRMFDNAGELRFSVFDLLHQNASVYRTVNPVSIDNSQTQVITRYAMLTFSYRIRAFDQGNMPEPNFPRPRH